MSAAPKMEKGHTPTTSDFMKTLETEHIAIESEIISKKEELKILRQDLKAINSLIERQEQRDLFDTE